jgi:hypothetical protein
MSQYLLSTYAVGGEPPASMSPEDMQAFMERVYALGADGDLVVTDGLSRLLKP